jgi:hypothetical protein
MKINRRDLVPNGPGSVKVQTISISLNLLFLGFDMQPFSKKIYFCEWNV